jgi:hydrogenase nickel incorporation protein HypA/HybF
MHELSIAESVVAVASRHARGRRVEKVTVRAGHLRQVVPAALELAFELVAEGTAVEGAKLEIEPVPAAGRCHDCGIESELEGFPLLCPRCGSLDVELISGEELLVDSLELEEEGPEEEGPQGQYALATRGA